MKNLQTECPTLFKRRPPGHTLLTLINNSFHKLLQFVIHANIPHRTLGLGCRGQFNLTGQVIHTYPLLKVFPERMMWTTNFRNVHNKESTKKGGLKDHLSLSSSRQIIGKKIFFTEINKLRLFSSFAPRQFKQA